MEAVRNKRSSRDVLGAVSAVLALAILGGGLFVAFARLDTWAMGTFARPSLAAALIAVVDVLLLLVAIALAPLLSEILRKVGRLVVRER
jgi:hypothetical protein